MRRFRLDILLQWRPAAETLEVDVARARRLAQEAWDKGQALAADGDAAGALAWLGRAHRIAPADQNILFGLAWQHLRAGDAPGAASLFGELAERHPTRECLSGLIAACLAAGRREQARAVAQIALSKVATDPGLSRLAARVVAACGLSGWCGLDEAGWLLTDVGDSGLRATLDGVDIKLRACGPGRFSLQGGPFQAGRLDLHAGAGPLLGSPIEIGRMFRLEGFAERGTRVIQGWAWHPGAPGRKPALTITDAAGEKRRTVVAVSIAANVETTVPLAQPRRFSFAAAADDMLHVLGPDGRDLLGSPVAPFSPPEIPYARRRRRLMLDGETDVVIPVYRGLETTLDCIDSVLETVATESRIWVVNDASPEPALVAALEALAATGAIRLISSGDGTRNRGFPAAANAGMRAASGRHVVLLNSDTLVAEGWLARLREAACSAADIGTATPLSNEASILSYPGEAGRNPAPGLDQTRALASLASRANRGRLVDLPTAHGFCMFIRRDCLLHTGYFEENLFAQGYGEENDFSERARKLGWRHVAVPEVFVAHLGGVSFGAAREALLRRNLKLLEARHPGYRKRVDDWIAADPLFPARRRLDAARWAAETQRPNAAAKRGYLLVTHGGGGGTARIVAERGAFLRAAGYRPIVLRAAGDGVCEVDDGEGTFPNLRFSLPREFAALRRLLASAAPEGAELHHLLGHHHSVVDLFTSLGIPYDVWIHDYAWFCPRLSFITGDGKFCGEPEAAVCDRCVARWGQEIAEDISAAELRRRSAADLRGARSVIVPSADVARRVARHVPGMSAAIRPWESGELAAIATPRPGRRNRRIAVVGAIGVDKGFQVLLACAQDAALRRLQLEFVVVGYTVEDEKLLETGCAFITGAFKLGEATALIRAQGADLAFIPSIWPETWCYALSDAWEAGLPAVVFDIGTPPSRVRAARRGWVLPLGLPAPRVNDVLLSLSPASPPSQISAPSDTHAPHAN